MSDCNGNDCNRQLYDLGSFSLANARNLRKWDLAWFAAEQMLGFDANYAGGHYEMGMVKVQAGDTGAARSELKRAIELWKNADPDLDELSHAKQQSSALE